MQNWALAIAFAGVTIGVIIQFNTLTPEQRRKYRLWLILSLILIWVGTIIQMTITA
jgi:hypothetical protein